MIKKIDFFRAILFPLYKSDEKILEKRGKKELNSFVI